MNVHSIQTSAMVVALTIAIAFTGTSLQANPTHQDPSRGLSAHGTIAGAKELAASLYAIYASEEEFVIQCFDRKDRPETYSEQQLSRSAGKIWKARRDAEQLKLMGEPAGNDLAMKLQLLSAQVGGFGRAYGRTPKGRKTLQRMRTKLTKEQPRLLLFLKQAENALQQGKLESVEKLLVARGIDLNEDLVFFLPTERLKYEAPYHEVLSHCNRLNKAQQKRQYGERAQEVVAEQLAIVSSFSGEAKRISDELATGGTATLVEGQTGGPVEAFAHVAKLWSQASAALMRASTIQSVFTGKLETDIQPTAKQLKELAISRLISVIEAAANSTSSASVQGVYSKLLSEISVIERRCRNSAIGKSCEPALAKLAAKDPALAARLEAYRLATAEVLNWREAYAEQHAKQLEQDFSDALGVLDTQTEPEQSNRPNFAKSPVQSRIAPEALKEPANWVVYEAGARLIGKPITENRMIRLTPTSRSAVVPYDGRHYANVPVSLPSEQQVADLKTALLLDDTHGPLSMQAADAVSAADLHDYLSVSGVVQTVHLEAAATRFIGLPDVAYPLTPLGQLPSFPGNSNPLTLNCWRLDLSPQWAHHRYFTVQVPKQ